jgi:hypothetical protein
VTKIKSVKAATSAATTVFGKKPLDDSSVEEAKNRGMLIEVSPLSDAQ